MRNTIIVDGKRKTCRIYDAGEEVIDRYTIAFKGYRVRGVMWYPYLAANAFPFHPQGFGQHGESEYFMTGRHLGRRIAFDDCPEQVQRFILQNI